MSLDSNADLIIELWSRLKPHIPQKERLEVADLLVNVFDDHGACDGLEDQAGLDKELNAAVKSYYSIDEEIEDDDDDSY